MKKTVLVLAACGLSLTLQAQIDLGNRIRNKVNQRIEQRTDQAIDKTLNGVEKDAKNGAQSKSTKSGGSSGNAASAPASSGSVSTETENKPASAAAGSTELKSYSRFDFVPGDKIIFYEDFAQDNVADFPARWNTNGSGEVVTTNTLPGKWLKMQNGSHFTPEIKGKLPENYTIEYDLVLSANDNKGHIGSIYTTIVSTDRPEVLTSDGDAYFKTNFNFWADNTSSFGIQNSTGTISNSVDDPIEKDKAGKIIHVSIAVNKQRCRIWYEDKKFFDLPRLVPEGTTYNGIRFHPNSFDEGQPYMALISNLRVAEGTSDLRSKLMNEGKFSTTGITFDSGSDKIKPESYGVLKQIAGVLSSNADVKVKIVGHTDSDGADAANLDLSKKRAAAVKVALTKEFNISADRLQTDGKGETAPAAPNTTAESKANNRRVEFLKI